MKILIIGHSVVDKVHYKNEVKTSRGGVYFSVLGFLSSPADIELHLVTSYSEEYSDLFKDVYESVRFPVSPITEKMPVNHLYLKENDERDEIYEYIPEKLKVEGIENLDSFDGIYINMVSGFELGINELYQLRQSFAGEIYIDIHTLSRGVDENRKRYFRAIPHPEVWYGNVNFLQANEREILTLGAEHEGKDEIVENMLGIGVNGVIVTNEKKGAQVFYYQNEKKEFSFLNDSMISEMPCVGCGDFFGPVFFASWLNNRNYEKALTQGVTGSGLFIKYGSDYNKIKNELNERFN